MPRNEDNLKYDDDLKNEVNLKNEDDPKNEDNLKNEDYLKNGDDLKNEDNLILKTVSDQSLFFSWKQINISLILKIFPNIYSVELYVCVS